MKFKIFRFDKSSNSEATRFDTFEFDPKPGMTVLNALFYIQDKFDDSLAFRYSCRGAVCGSCAMLLNKVPRLACRTQVGALINTEDEIKLKPIPALESTETWEPGGAILIEPLPHLPVEKDLIVNMDKFFKYYRTIEPIFKPGGSEPEKERQMAPKKVTELEDYTNCILCAACFGACPVSSKNPNYYGPAALAKLYRFHLDTRETQDDSRVKLANNESGWWACEFQLNCKRICPKGVPPNMAIGRARQRLGELGLGPD
jgi:succinate dehydrogenase / fumarate reductase iron-sulfur subunit